MTKQFTFNQIFIQRGDIDCNEDLDCCGPLGEEQKCFTAQTCMAYEMQCESDYDCTPPSVCCNAGYFDMCLPPEACQ